MSRTPALQKSLQLIGTAYLAVQLLRLARGMFNYVRPRRVAMHLKAKYHAAGTWAVVTGASDGIGRALAMELGRCGFNVCIIARTQATLDTAAQAIRDRCGVQAMAIAFDFSTDAEADYQRLFQQLDAIEIAVLVNNVGKSHTNAELFEAPSIADDVAVVKLNCIPMLRLCKYIVPKLKAAGCGGIVNVSSLSAIIRAVPYLATYAGTKAFDRVFSEALTFELEPFGIDVLTVTPGFVSTKLTQGDAQRPPRVSFQMVDADSMARDTIAELGVRTATSGHRNHELVSGIYGMLPLWITGRLTYRRLKAISDKRKRKADAAAAVAAPCHRNREVEEAPVST